MLDALLRPWPWYVAGPLIGLMVPVLLVLGNREFGVSSSLRHMCAATIPGRAEYFRYDWRRTGAWNIAFVAGVLLGGWIAAQWLGGNAGGTLSDAARADLAAMGVREFSGLVPGDLFNWSVLGTARGLFMLVGGGLLIGFGTAWAGGCTSGHAISGLAAFQLPSLIATVAFFTGGVITSWLILPRLLS